MLRAGAAGGKLELRIDEPTRKPIAELASLLQNVPAARLFDEMLKMLFSGQAYQCVRMLRQEGLHQGIFPLLDVIAEESAGADFIRLALENTDRRIREDKPVSVGFLLATLLWGQVQREWTRRMDFGDKSRFRRCLTPWPPPSASRTTNWPFRAALPPPCGKSGRCNRALTTATAAALSPAGTAALSRRLRLPGAARGGGRSAAGAGGLVDGVSGGRRSPAPGADLPPPATAARRTGAKKRRRRKKKPNGQGQPMDDGE